MNHGARQSHTMYLSGGKGPYLAVDEHTHSHQIGQFFQTVGRVGVEAIVHGGEELQIFSRRKPLVETAVGGGVKPKLGADLRALAFDVVSGDAGAAACRHQKRCQNAQQRGLAGTVGPDQSSDRKELLTECFNNYLELSPGDVPEYERLQAEQFPEAKTVVNSIKEQGASGKRDIVRSSWTRSSARYQAILSPNWKHCLSNV